MFCSQIYIFKWRYTCGCVFLLSFTPTKLINLSCFLAPSDGLWGQRQSFFYLLFIVKAWREIQTGIPKVVRTTFFILSSDLSKKILRGISYKTAQSLLYILFIVMLYTVHIKLCEKIEIKYNNKKKQVE